MFWWGLRVFDGSDFDGDSDDDHGDDDDDAEDEDDILYITV